MVYDFDRKVFEVLENLNIGDTITTQSLHNKIMKAGFTGLKTRINFIKNMEISEYIFMKDTGIWEIKKMPPRDKYGCEEKYLAKI